MTINGFNPDIGDRHEFPKLKKQFNEDPARFLQSGSHLALARIRGIRDAELLEAYRAVAKQISTGSTRRQILDALETRERELAGEPIEPAATKPAPAMAIATDGGTAAAEPETNEEPEPARELDDLHPDARGLKVGEVLIVDRDDSTKYIFPTTPDADKPYLLRTLDNEENERTDEPIPLATAEIQSRLGLETEKHAANEIDIRAPAAAATSNERPIMTDGGIETDGDWAGQPNSRNSSHPHGHASPVPIGMSVPSGFSRAANIDPQLSQIATALGNSCMRGVIIPRSIWSEYFFKASRNDKSYYIDISITEDVRLARSRVRNGGAQ